MNILCAVEDSPSGRHVANIAADVSRRLQAELSCVTGNRARLLGAASKFDYDLLVIGSAPADGLPAGTRSRLLRRAKAPVMVVADDGAIQRFDRIVLAYDGSDPARSAAATTAADLAWRLDATISVVLPIAERRRYAHPKWHVERRAARDIRAAGGDGIDVDFVRRVGRPARELARAVAELKPAFVVVGEDRPSAWSGLRRSLGRDVLRRTRHPVVHVTPQPSPSGSQRAGGGLDLENLDAQRAAGRLDVDDVPRAPAGDRLAHR